ncbi:MAG: TolC family protein [Bacteroides sp.]
MKRLVSLTLLLSVMLSLNAQNFLSLDSCRALAIANNKDLLIAGEKVNVAHYRKKSAFTNYLPEISATGTYMRNQKEFSLLSDEQKDGLQNLGTNVTGQIGAQLSAALQQMGPNNPSFPFLQQLAGALGQLDLATPLNAAGTSVMDALRTDTRNVYAGAITLTQPLYMGGKIRAYNKITNYAELLAKAQQNTNLQEVILSTDQTYWQVVSLANKKKLADGYLKLLRKLEGDVDKMIAEGVATKADGLSVKVKVNEAEITLTKVENGLSLSKMLLCQLCGLNISTSFKLADEDIETLKMQPAIARTDASLALSNRPEIRSLELAGGIYEQKVNVARSEHLPSLALLGNYMVSNPSVFNSFENKFHGMWNVGVMLKIPICHWGDGFYKVKAAKAEARIAQYKLSDAKEKIELQVSQSTFKVNEAVKTLEMAEKNMDKANENLRYATLGFEEGVIAASNVLEAQTAWLSAHSEKIDAQIDVKLTEVYLQKAMGNLK